MWALQDYGFKVVIAPRFGDIFRGNSGKAGLLTAQVDDKVVLRLWDLMEAEPGTTITVDLDARTVRAGDGPDAVEDSFDIDDYTRWRLLEGLDDISLTLAHESRHRGVRSTIDRAGSPRLSDHVASSRTVENPQQYKGNLVVARCASSSTHRRSERAVRRSKRRR